MEIGETIDVTTAEEFRKWLTENHKTRKKIAEGKMTEAGLASLPRHF